MTGIVLAGGLSSRLGRDKCVLPVGGQRLIDRVLERLNKVASEMMVVFSQRQSSLPFSVPSGVKRGVDIFPDKGSLGGLYTGLKLSGTCVNLVVACDMPFLNPQLLGHLLSLSVDYDVVIPRVEGKVEPLHAAYSKQCTLAIEEALRQDRRRIVDFFGAVKVRYVEENELRWFDPDLLSLFNINTLEDLEKAESLATQQIAPEGMG